MTSGAQGAKDFIRRALDGDYARRTQDFFEVVNRNLQSGQLGSSLSDLQTRAQQLAADNETFAANDPYIRAVRADWETVVRRIAQQLDAMNDSMEISGANAAAVIQPQLAFGGLDPQTIGLNWNQPDPTAVLQTINYSQSAAMQESLEKFSTHLNQVFSNTAVQGVASGWNPLKTAQELQRIVQDLPIHYANSLMRSVQLNAWRDASVLQQVANADILEGSIRIATLDDRCCLACIALHGTFLPLGQKVFDHRMGRCDSIPVLKERPRNIQTGPDWLAGLPEDRQRNLAGFKNAPAKFEAWKAGAVKLEEFVHHDTDPVFGEVVMEASLKGILGDAAKNYYKAQ